jgi:GcrA cell cycle regulator
MGDNRDHSWTDERVELLKQHFHAGLSATESAKILRGVSRNAVISKRFRLGLAHGDRAPRVRVDSALVNHRLKARAAKAPPVARAPHQNAGLAFRTRAFTARAPEPTTPDRPAPEPAPVPAAARGLHIRDEGFGGCRWPIGEDDDGHLHCCAPRRPGAIYCDDHKARSYTRAPAIHVGRLAA